MPEGEQGCAGAAAARAIVWDSYVVERLSESSYDLVPEVSFAYSEESPRSEASWDRLEISCGDAHASSEASWSFAQAQSCDADTRSEVSWDVVDRPFAETGCDSPWVHRTALRLHGADSWSSCPSIISLGLVWERPTQQSLEGPCCSSGHAEVTLVDLVRARRWSCALQLLRSPAGHDFAQQCDSDGDTPLAWAAYKAGQSVACLETICVLILLFPAALKQRSKGGFLPLHEAAWGNAHAAIGTVLAAAWPEALEDVGPRQTPTRSGSLPSP